MSTLIIRVYDLELQSDAYRTFRNIAVQHENLQYVSVVVVRFVVGNHRCGRLLASLNLFGMLEFVSHHSYSKTGSVVPDRADCMREGGLSPPVLSISMVDIFLDACGVLWTEE